MIPLEDRIKQQAHALGFELVGIAQATEADTFDRLRSWLDQGFAGEMAYLHRHGDARRHPSSILEGVRSVILAGMNYRLDPTIETMFLMASEQFSHVSSSLLRQIASLGGDLSKFLPEAVKKPLVDRAKQS